MTCIGLRGVGLPVASSPWFARGRRLVVVIVDDKSDTSPCPSPHHDPRTAATTQVLTLPLSMLDGGTSAAEEYTTYLSNVLLYWHGSLVLEEHLPSDLAKMALQYAEAAYDAHGFGKATLPIGRTTQQQLPRYEMHGQFDLRSATDEGPSFVPYDASQFDEVVQNKAS